MCARLQFSRRLQRTGSHAALCSNRRSSPAPSTHLNMESFSRKIYWKFPRVTETNLRASERVKKGPVRKNSGVLEWRDSTLCSPSLSTTDRTLPFVLLTYTKASPFSFRSHDQPLLRAGGVRMLCNSQGGGGRATLPTADCPRSYLLPAGRDNMAHLIRCSVCACGPLTTLIAEFPELLDRHCWAEP